MFCTVRCTPHNGSICSRCSADQPVLWGSGRTDVLDARMCPAPIQVSCTLLLFFYFFVTPLVTSEEPGVHSDNKSSLCRGSLRFFGGIIEGVFWLVGLFWLLLPKIGVGVKKETIGDLINPKKQWQQILNYQAWLQSVKGCIALSGLVSRCGWPSDSDTSPGGSKCVIQGSVCIFCGCPGVAGLSVTVGWILGCVPHL